MDNELAAGIGSIWGGNFAAQEQRVAAQEQALIALVAGSLDENARQAAASAAHKLAGSLGTFGLDEGSRLAAQIEAAWHDQAPAATGVSALAGAIASLRRVVEAHRPVSDPETPASSKPVDPAALDVLLVDDDDVFARYVLEPLQRRYRVRWLSSGESALATLTESPKQRPPRVILLDIEMPGMHGLTVLEQLADKGVATHSAIVMLTRRTVVEDIVRARRLGAFDFLAKPISVSMLNQRVGRALESVRV